MYEPRNLPQLNEAISALSSMRFSIVYNNKYSKADDPDADPLHIHNYLEIFLNVSSDISFLVNNNLYPVPEGDVVISRPGDIHMGIFHKAAVQEHICIWIIVLSSRIAECCECENCGCELNFPECVSNCFNGNFAVPASGRKVLLTLGLFTIVQLERRVQMLIPAYDFCIPGKECVTTTDDPCEVFKHTESSCRRTSGGCPSRSLYASGYPPPP